MTSIRILALCLCCLVLNGRADAAGIETFPRIAALTGSDESIRRVELPFEVMLDAARSDLGDVHVFDALGALAPSNTYYLKSRGETLVSQVDLQFFPFDGEASSETIRYSFQLDQDEQSTQINLSTQGPDAAAARAKTNYIVHIPKEIRKSGPLSSLELSWGKPRQNLIVPIRVEGSADLQSWQTLAERAVVSDLEHNGASLITNKIHLKPFAGAYLRLTWPERIAQFDLQRITGAFTRSRVESVELRRRTLACDPSVTDVCQFEIPPQVSVQSLRLSTPDTDYFLQGTFYSESPGSRKNGSAWVNRGSFQQYRLTVDGQTISNAELNLPHTRDRLWQLRFDESQAEPDIAAIEIRWYPVYQAFMAQGQEPYQLAYGSPGAVNPARKAMDTILSRANKPIDDVATVFLGPMTHIERDVAYWTKQRIEVFVLWSVLVLGVAVLFRIALGLYRNMNAVSRD